MDAEESKKVLRKLFRRAKVVTLVALLKALDTTSRMTVFRHLKQLGYYSSFSHRGKYYTLKENPKFDGRGLWFHGDVGFSRQRTLANTVIKLIEDSERGMTHGELKALLRINVFNSLSDLVEKGRLDRHEYEGNFVYVGATKALGGKQMSARRVARREAELPSDYEAVHILVELIKSPGSSVRDLAQRLRSHGIRIAERLIENLLVCHDLQKKIRAQRE